MCVFFHSALCERSFAGISEALCVCIFHWSRGVYDVVFVCIAFALCFIFVARAGYAGQCVYIFHCSFGVCRAVRLFSLILSVIHSLLALCMRGTVCVYFIARVGHMGQCKDVYFRILFCVNYQSTAFTGAIAVYHF
jgi:hypothetical protein